MQHVVAEILAGDHLVSTLLNRGNNSHSDDELCIVVNNCVEVGHVQEPVLSLTVEYELVQFLLDLAQGPPRNLLIESG